VGGRKGVEREMTGGINIVHHRISDLSRKKRKHLNRLLREGELPTILPPELRHLEQRRTVLLWFDSGRQNSVRHFPRITWAWEAQPLGGASLNKESFFLHARTGSVMAGCPPDPALISDGKRVAAFNPPLPRAASFQGAPNYVTDLIAAWYGIASLRLSGYTEQIDTVSDGMQAVYVMTDKASPRFVAVDRNVGLELKESIRSIGGDHIDWHFIPRVRTKFLNANQGYHKRVVREFLD
jgi:hypothetical protein